MQGYRRRLVLIIFSIKISVECQFPIQAILKPNQDSGRHTSVTYNNFSQLNTVSRTYSHRLNILNVIQPVDTRYSYIYTFIYHSLCQIRYIYSFRMIEPPQNAPINSACHHCLYICLSLSFFLLSVFTRLITTDQIFKTLHFFSSISLFDSISLHFFSRLFHYITPNYIHIKLPKSQTLSN